MKVLICGGRDYSNYQDLKSVLDKFFITEIISGGARGADSLAIQYAKARRIPYREYPANWKKHGRKAGVLRNQEMLDSERPRLVIAFPGGKGTADMVRRARRTQNTEVIALNSLS